MKWWRDAMKIGRTWPLSGMDPETWHIVARFILSKSARLKFKNPTPRIPEIEERND